MGAPKSQKTQTNTVNDGKENEEPKSKPRAHRTKKSKICPLIVRIVEQNKKWIVKKMTDSHNQPMLDQDDIDALPAHRKLTTEQNNLIADSIKANTSTLATNNTINRLYTRCPNTTVKDVINSKTALRNAMKAGHSEKSLLSLMQSLELKGVEQQIKDGELT